MERHDSLRQDEVGAIKRLDDMMNGVYPVAAPKQPERAQLGTASFAVILCKFNDIAIPDRPISFFGNIIAPGEGGIYDYWNEVSYAQLNLNNSAVFGWYTMQYSFFESTTQPRGTWIAEARRLAANAGVDLAKFHGVIAVVNAGGGHYLSTKYGVDEGEHSVDVSVDVPAVWGQNDWWWCKKCQTLNYGGLTAGPCPAGGDHDDSSSNSYSLALNQPEFPGQIDWRWCLPGWRHAQRCE